MMKRQAIPFLSESEKKRITEAVHQAEQRTSGEIVVMTVPAAYTYPVANITGAAVLALPLSLVLTPVLGGMLWVGTRDMFVFIGIFSLLFIACHKFIQWIPGLKRIFITQGEIDAEVREAAVTTFYREKLYKTREQNSVLIFISIFEHKVWVLADEGIDAKVEDGQWQNVADLISRGIKTNRAADAICEAVSLAGELLAEHFPPRPDDTNELKNLIIEG